MKIGIDVRLWNQGGVGRYIRNLVLNLGEVDRKNNYVLFVRKSEQEQIKKTLNNDKFETVATNSRWHSFSEQYAFPKVIDKENLDLMHFTYPSVPIFYKKPYVVTIHDLIPYHYPTGDASALPLWLYGFKMIAYRLVINNAARKASKIIAVSHSTKEEIADHLITNKNKIEVVYEAADDFKPPANKQPELKNYFLYAGNVYPHKNADFLIETFKSLGKKTKLVFSGWDDIFYQRLRKRYRGLEAEGRLIFKFDSNDKELADLYSGAACLIRPSLMEGFSLPPLEAVRSNCLVLLSDIPVHREIFGNDCVYFNPKDRSDLLEKMEFMLSLNADKKNKTLEDLKERIKDFSWEKTARQTLKIYESSLGL